MAKISVLPPDDDDDRLRRALGQTAVEPPPPPPPHQQRPVMTETLRPAPVLPASRTASKVTVSVRMAPETQARLAEIGDAIGWSSNKIMTALVEQQAAMLSDVYERNGEAGVLKILRGR